MFLLLEEFAPFNRNPCSIPYNYMSFFSSLHFRGSFVIFGDLKPEMPKDLIQAYPPSRVRRKVYEFSRLLPDTLQFELVPRGHIWSSLFHNRYPGKEDIGLYFFASERERSVSALISLPAKGKGRKAEVAPLAQEGFY